MHLLMSYKSGALTALPQTLPLGLYEAAARRGRPVSGTRAAPVLPANPNIQRQFSGMAPQRTASPLTRPPQGPAAVSTPPQPTIRPPPENTWAISPQEQARFYEWFAQQDTQGRGFLSGEQAVEFFSSSRLPEDTLATIWDLADINGEGKLNRDEFAVAMYLIMQARKGPLPASLPPNLVPPSMRRQPVQPLAQPNTMTQPAASPSSVKPTSAVDDLFGLDAFTAPVLAPQVPQSTGGSTTQSAISPQHTASLPLQPQRTQQSNIFKPFVPSSSFGQKIMTPQTTGATNSTSPVQPRQISHSDDLLGDNDPDISARLTQETTELANLSNQVGTLTNQMQTVKSQRASTEENISQVSAQKRDFEMRLGQLRSAYEQEVRDVKALEERLVASKNDTQRVQQDLAMVQHTYQNLQEQHQQVIAALQADQAENAKIKERMRQVNAEIAELKPQLEKLRSEARQQKGLVAINKKQLSTIEAEHDRVKQDLDGATKELSEATQEAESSKRALEAATAAQIQLPPSSVASPAPSTTSQSMNPFFRRPTNATAERGMSQSAFAPQVVASPNHTIFDNFFGSSLNETNPNEPVHPSAPAAAFFDSESSTLPYSGIVAEPARATPEPHSPEAVFSSSVHNELPLSNALPPPPPQSRQITSSFLPFGNQQTATSSVSSSVGVAPPTSRFGDNSTVATPRNERQISQPGISPSDLRQPPTAHDFNSPQLPSPFPERKSSLSGSADSRRPSAIGIADANNSYREAGQPSAPQDNRNSFPSESTPFHTPLSDSGQLDETVPKPDTPFHNDIGPHQATVTKPPPMTMDDFDSVFADFGTESKAPEKAPPLLQEASGARPAGHGEFPPIQEFGDDSDSETDRGFDDNFSSATPQRESMNPISKHTSLAATGRPDLNRGVSDISELPTPDAQQSPPTYDSTVYPNGHTTNHDPNQFPAEYGGLLPSREDPTSPSAITHSPEAAVRSPSNGDASSFFGGMTSKERALSGTSLPAAQMPMAPGATAAPFAYDNKQAQAQLPSFQNPPALPPKSGFDDFDDEFADLTPAQAADDKGDDDLTSSFRGEGFDEFNPTFDSPAPSKANTFHDFESSIISSGTGSSSKAIPASTSNHDWDAIFAGLDEPASVTNGHGNEGLPFEPKENSPTELPATSISSTPGKPTLGRALTAGTEHDDPILKRLTGMGYPRAESLAALERFDYNLDKVCFSTPILTKIDSG
jgi:epidermal growth factor receptor substrate 15